MLDGPGTTTALRTSTETRERAEGVLHPCDRLGQPWVFLINLLAGGSWWFFWPLIGWGIGLGVHALNVFGFGGALGRDWEERKTRELMDEEER